MRGLIRNSAIYALALFLTSGLLPGLKVTGGFPSFILGGFLLYLLLIILRPVLGIVSIPLNIVTLGLFSTLTNVIILYLLTVFLPRIRIEAFTFKGYDVAGFVVPRFELNTFFAFVVVSAVLSLIITFITWIIKK